ncbi:MAG: primosomal protein N', partial [Proteobacteria bacterium]|nr:primosomal protein N' [Pseudomonadota bacterium]
MVHTKIAEGGVVRVLVPLALPTLLDYRCAEACAVGDWVEVPVGKRGVDGVVVDVLAESVFGNLKIARRRDDVPPLSAVTLAFYRWVARYTLSAPGEPLRVALPQARIPVAPKIKKPPKKSKKLASAQSVEVAAPAAIVLNEAQAVAAGEVVGALGGFKAFLLDGVTGSGKTEVYFEVMARVLAGGGQILVLVPEIALTPQWLARFTERFGMPPLVWHSGLATGAKRAAWWALARGEAKVVVGARSALFLPFSNLQLVVVDEEHEPSYKQDEAFRYHARDMAVQAANLWRCPVVLASATPSLETWQRVQEGKYQRLVLPSRHGGSMAAVKLVDLRKEKIGKQEYIGGELRGAVSA